MTATHLRQHVLPAVKSLVVKVGTNALCDAEGRLDEAAVESLCSQLLELRERDVQVTLVASGAVGAGMAELGLATRPKDVPTLQATAAVGQRVLMQDFGQRLSPAGLHIGQVLVTAEDFPLRERFLNIRNTLLSLHRLGVLPIINENDATAVYELRCGDNDLIAAHVAAMLSADALVLLTTVDAVLDNGRPLDVIEEVNDETMALVENSKSALGSGGMGTKLQAARLTIRAGGIAVIANAREPRILPRLLDGEPLGTVFVPAERKLSSRRRWLAGPSEPAGTLLVDAGAAHALLNDGKSLLAIGVTSAEGDFSEGDVVRVQDSSGAEIARGLTNYSAGDLAKIQGQRSDAIEAILGESPYDEVIHRDNLVLV
ncbi:MAG: glutamate 5-kinase [Phycisphaerales bacterium]|jgi:glutamate 5-kinase|nr:glutamate 5-kinase [Phycisphaerales bacterium]MBT7171068.1 glutamate 5-kinase [Phycisphaerales bacterium]